MGRSSPWSRLSLLSTRHREARPGADFTVNLLQVETDGVCPRCLGWIGPADIVRRTAYGPLQHEACPAVASLVHHD